MWMRRMREGTYEDLNDIKRSYDIRVEMTNDGGHTCFYYYEGDKLLATYSFKGGEKITLFV